MKRVVLRRAAAGLALVLSGSLVPYIVRVPARAAVPCIKVQTWVPVSTTIGDSTCDGAPDPPPPGALCNTKGVPQVIRVDLCIPRPM